MNWIRSDKKPNSDTDEDAYQQTKTTLSSMERNLSKLNESLKKYSKQVQAVTNNELQIFTELSSNAENDTELRFSSMTAYSELSSGSKSDLFRLCPTPQLSGRILFAPPQTHVQYFYIMIY